MNDIKVLEEKVQEILDISSVEELDINLIDRLIEQLTQRLDLCIGFPVVKIFSTIHKVGKSFFDYKMCVRLLKFYQGCKNINQEQRNKFYERYIYGKEKEVGYKCIQLLERLDADEKALLIGKLYVYCVENEHDMKSYFRICRIVEQCYFDDLEFLVHWKLQEHICSNNKFIPQEIMESLYSSGLLLEDGYDNGGFKEDEDSGTMFILSKFGQILLNIIE